MLGYRLVRGISIVFPYSYCPSCKHSLAWYDNIPLISFIFLRGKCRYCEKPISLLYPFIELLTVLVMLGLFYLIDSHYWFSYFIFFSALIVTIRTDFETMLISRYTTLFLIPLGFVLSIMGLLPITLSQSIIGTLFGYFFLYSIAKTFFWYTNKEGMGQGDLELLACIGSFTGFLGCWITLMLASTIGALCGITYMIISGQRHSVKIPFGPFLALGAIAFVLFQNYFFTIFLLL